MPRYEKELDQWMKKKSLYKKDNSKVFVVVKGQCRLTMKNKLASLPDYKALENNDDIIDLLQKIKDLTFTTKSV